MSKETVSASTPTLNLLQEMIADVTKKLAGATAVAVLESGKKRLNQRSIAAILSVILGDGPLCTMLVDAGQTAVVHYEGSISTAAPAKAAGGPRMSKEARAGLTLSVARIQVRRPPPGWVAHRRCQNLAEDNKLTIGELGKESTAYIVLTAVIQRLLEEIIRPAIKRVQDGERVRIEPVDIQAEVKLNPGLAVFFPSRRYYFAAGGPAYQPEPSQPKRKRVPGQEDAPAAAEEAPPPAKKARKQY